ncbi:MAG TPA: cytochrome b [Gammaproteobacteria bacterium]
MLKNSTENYGSLSKVIHWLMAILIVMLLAVGFYMTGLDKEDPARGQIYGMHKAFGTLALIMVVIRVVWLRISAAPALPAVFTPKEKRLVSSIKGVLYLLMFLAPISGYVMSSAAGRATSFFGLFDLPMLIGENKALAGIAHEAHELLAFLMIAFIVVHVAGAIKHRLKDRNGPSDIMNRML